MFTQPIKKLLENAGWNITNFPNEVSNTETGCKITGQLVDVFIQEIIQELLEEHKEKTKPKLTDEEVLSSFGYTIICESPFEIEDSNQNITTGQCASWVVQELRQQLDNK